MICHLHGMMGCSCRIIPDACIWCGNRRCTCKPVSIARPVPTLLETLDDAIDRLNKLAERMRDGDQ